MTTGPNTVNKVATVVDAGINGVGSVVVKATETAMIADQPWLGAPIIKPMWEAVFQWFAGYFEKQIDLCATFAVVDAQVGSERTTISKALAALIVAEKSGNQNAIQTALKNYSATQTALANDDGSAAPSP